MWNAERRMKMPSVSRVEDEGSMVQFLLRNGKHAEREGEI